MYTFSFTTQPPTPLRPKPNFPPSATASQDTLHRTERRRIIIIIIIPGGAHYTSPQPTPGRASAAAVGDKGVSVIIHGPTDLTPRITPCARPGQSPVQFIGMPAPNLPSGRRSAATPSMEASSKETNDFWHQKWDVSTLSSWIGRYMPAA